MYPGLQGRARGRDGAQQPKPESGWFGLKKLTSRQSSRVPGAEPEAGAIPIRGINGDLPVRFAPEGGAVPGDRIVGIVSPGEGITIYPIQSPALAEFEDKPERWLDVRWDLEERTRRSVFRAHCGAVGQTSRVRWRRSPRSSPSMTAISTTSA